MSPKSDRVRIEGGGHGRQEQPSLDWEGLRVGDVKDRVKRERASGGPPKDGVKGARILLMAEDHSIELGTVYEWSLEIRSDWERANADPMSYSVQMNRTWELTANGGEGITRTALSAQDHRVNRPITIDLGDDGRFEGKVTSLRSEDRGVEIRALGRLRQKDSVSGEGT